MLRSIIAAAAAAFAFAAHAQCVSCGIELSADCVAPGGQLEIDVFVTNGCDLPVEVEASLIAHAPEGEEYVIEARTFVLPPIEASASFLLTVPEDIARGDYDLEVTILEGDHVSTCAAAVTVSDDCG